MKGLKIKETSATACILNSQVNAHIFFSIVGLALLFGCNREMVWDTSPVCIVCISQPGFPSVSWCAGNLAEVL